jgi:hypothetical protein
MKRISAIVALFLVAFSMNAQDVTTKNGKEILPVAGEIALGVNAAPFVNALMNTFNGNTNNQFATSNKFLSSTAIVGKYMLSDNSAIRVALGTSTATDVDRRLVFDDASTNPDDMVTDARTANSSFYKLHLGYEMRRGNSRVQGYYGADLRFQVQGSNTKYSYGNGFAQNNVTPTFFDSWGNDRNDGARLTNTYGTRTLNLGLRGFVGVEYFVAPKISLGTEFGWGMYYNQNVTAGQNTYEYYEMSTGNVIIDEVNAMNSRSSDNRFSTGVDNFDASLFLMFYF